MSIKTLILSTVTAFTFAASSSAANIDVALDAGATNSRSIAGQIDSDKDNVFGGSVRVEYNDGSLGVGVAYNLFDNLRFKTLNETGKTGIHGPEVYGRFAPRFGGFQPYLKGGVMWAMTRDCGDIMEADKKVTPTIGAGFDYWFTDGFAVRVGYDKYFEIYDNGSAKTGDASFDLDYYHAGIKYRF